MKLKNVQRLTILMAIALTISCKTNAQHSERNHSEKKGHETKMMKRAHERDYEGGENEEDDTLLQKNETFNQTKKGVQLVLKFDEKSNTFKGFMQNKYNKPIKRARVEIHLSNGKELGPTKPITLQPNQKHELVIKSTKKGFTTWSTHAEVGSNEHSHEGNGHEGRERGEHGNKNERNGEH
ncbi:hypothetical protein [Tenacibaculum holothuriorum]|nr:hypothetical protein [Tenacibaculum holothuriorum]